VAVGCQSPYTGKASSTAITAPAATTSAVTGTPQPATAAKTPTVKPPAETPLTETSTDTGAPALAAQTDQPFNTVAQESKAEDKTKPTQTAQAEQSARGASEASILGVTEDQPEALGKTKTVNHQKFSSANPTLMGLKLSDTKKSVVSQYGNPVRTFVMDDGESPINIAEYKGFTVGFTEQEKLVFVSIDSTSVDPGLNGLRWGDKADDALKALGMPETNTGYVISYMGKNAILKLDIDPKTEVIRSIKLFAKSK
jgi:hypothetical protein